MFNSLGRLIARHRVTVLAVMVVVMALLGLAGNMLGKPFGQGGFEDPKSGWATAEMLEQEAYGRDSVGDVVVTYHAPEGTDIDDPAFLSRIQSSLDQIKAEHPGEVTGVTSYSTNHAPALANRDAGVVVASIQIGGEGEQILENFRAIEDQIPVDGIQTDVAGQQPVAGALQDGMDADLVRAEMIALPLVFLLLIVVFGGVVAAFLPVAVGVLTIIGALGALHLLSLLTPVNSFAQNVVTLIGLGLAIDYGLFVVSRFREEMAEGYPPDAAVRRTMATAGRTVVFSAVMVGVTLSGLLLFPQAFLKSVAYGAIAAVVLAALLSVTVLPAVLVLLGRRVDLLGLAFLRRRRGGDDRTVDHATRGGLFARLADFSMRHPVMVAAPIVIVLVALILPFSNVRFGGINETYLPPDNPTRVAQEQYDADFPGSRTDPVKLVVVGSDATSLSAIRAEANKAPHLTGPFTFAKSGKKDSVGNEIVVLQSGLTDRNDAGETVDYLHTFPIPAGTQVFVGGNPAMETDSIDALQEGLPWFALYVFVATAILLFLAFGSLVLPLKAAIMNMLGLGATLGVLTWIFVDGHGASMLGFTPWPLTSPVVVLLMAIIYGLSTDYEVFLLSRMVEARSRGESTANSIRSGVVRTGGIITSAALILIVVTGAFAFSEIVMMKYIAFGMIAALILDATVIRMLLVPAVMQLLGEDSWWAPRWMKRVQEKIGLAEGEIDDEPELLVGAGAGAGAGAGGAVAATAGSTPARERETAHTPWDETPGPDTEHVLDTRHEDRTRHEAVPHHEPEPHREPEPHHEPETPRARRDREREEYRHDSGDGRISAADLIERLLREQGDGR